MLKRNSINVYSNTWYPALEICQKWEHVRLAVKVILGNFWSFLLKAHTCYPTYDREAYFSDWTVAALWNSPHENVL